MRLKQDVIIKESKNSLNGSLSSLNISSCSSVASNEIVINTPPYSIKFVYKITNILMNLSYLCMNVQSLCIHSTYNLLGLSKPSYDYTQK